MCDALCRHFVKADVRRNESHSARRYVPIISDSEMNAFSQAQYANHILRVMCVAQLLSVFA